MYHLCPLPYQITTGICGLPLLDLGIFFFLVEEPFRTLKSLKTVNLLSAKKHCGQQLTNKRRRSPSKVVGMSPNSLFKEYLKSDDQQKQLFQPHGRMALWSNG